MTASLLIGLWGALCFTLGWVIRFRLYVVERDALQLDRRLLVSVSHLLEDAESALSSIEGVGAHRFVQQRLTDAFVRAKSCVTLAQPVVRKLLGVDQQIGRGAVQAIALPNGGAWLGPVQTAPHGHGCQCVICAARALDFPGADRHSL
jgi:hypothetical protein